MSNKISGNRGINNINTQQQQQNQKADNKGGKGKFAKMMGTAADVALKTTSAVAPTLPGGQLVGMAADGLQGLRNRQPGAGGSGGLNGAPGEQISDAWAMQQQNQVFNMQYMQLQQAMQADNRNFSTMSNLMKARHDTAKAAINNMHA